MSQRQVFEVSRSRLNPSSPCQTEPVPPGAPGHGAQLRPPTPGLPRGAKQRWWKSWGAGNRMPGAVFPAKAAPGAAWSRSPVPGAPLPGPAE